jgi:hypothetical protein
MALRKKYVIFKDDDVGISFNNLKRWVNTIIEKNAKGSIGLIGKYLKNKRLTNYLNEIDHQRIEIFCHGYKHSYLPFLIAKIFGRNNIIRNEFDRTFQNHNTTLRKYRSVEDKYLRKKSITFGPPGNIWNESVIDALLKNDFRLMFSWKKIKRDIFTLPLSMNYEQSSLEEFIKSYDEHKNVIIFTLQFHHAKLTEEQFNILPGVIDFLKNEEKRVFVKPSDILEISKKDEDIFRLISPLIG